MTAQFKFLCSTEQVCPEVKQILKEMGFTNFKDLKKSPSFDISAKYVLEDETAEEVATSILDKCHGNVQNIQITQ